MGLISKSVTLVSAAAGLAAASQLPEFSQQYRQRLAGAVEELRVVVTDFDKDAESSGMSRTEAMNQLVSSKESFPRERGQSMARTINRFEKLDKQQRQMEAAEPISRPVFLFSTYDEKLLKGSWEIFEPAVPLTASGAVWGGFGAFFLGFLARIPIGMFGWIGRKAKRRADKRDVIGGIKVDPHPEETVGPIEADPLNISSQHAIRKTKNTSLLDQIVLEERVVGEIDTKGHLVRKI